MLLYWTPTYCLNKVDRFLKLKQTGDISSLVDSTPLEYRLLYVFLYLMFLDYHYCCIDAYVILLL